MLNGANPTGVRPTTQTRDGLGGCGPVRIEHIDQRQSSLRERRGQGGSRVRVVASRLVQAGVDLGGSPPNPSPLA